jgi:hypothetical protein
VKRQVYGSVLTGVIVGALRTTTDGDAVADADAEGTALDDDEPALTSMARMDEVADDAVEELAAAEDVAEIDADAAAALNEAEDDEAAVEDEELADVVEVTETSAALTMVDDEANADADEVADVDDDAGFTDADAETSATLNVTEADEETEDAETVVEAVAEVEVVESIVTPATLNPVGLGVEMRTDIEGTTDEAEGTTDERLADGIMLMRSSTSKPPVDDAWAEDEVEVEAEVDVTELDATSAALKPDEEAEAVDDALLLDADEVVDEVVTPAAMNVPDDEVEAEAEVEAEDDVMDEAMDKELELDASAAAIMADKEAVPDEEEDEDEAVVDVAAAEVIVLEVVPDGMEVVADVDGWAEEDETAAASTAMICGTSGRNTRVTFMFWTGGGVAAARLYMPRRRKSLGAPWGGCEAVASYVDWNDSSLEPRPSLATSSFCVSSCVTCLAAAAIASALLVLDGAVLLAVAVPLASAVLLEAGGAT